MSFSNQISLRYMPLRIEVRTKDLVRLNSIVYHVAFKRIAASEIDRSVSKQQAIYGTKSIRKMLGEPGDEKRYYQAKVVYLDDEIEPFVEADSIQITWGDRRANVQKRESEYRFYYKSGSHFERAAVGDTLFIIKLANSGTDELLLAIVEQQSNIEAQLLAIFGFDSAPEAGSEYRSPADMARVEVGFAEAELLRVLGVEVNLTDPDGLALMIEKYPDGFPTTAEFSRFARERSGVQVIDGDPDRVLVHWIETELRLFRSFERHLLLPKLDSIVDVESFLALSLSVQNRRKSRAGRALENHLGAVFDDYQLQYQPNAITENNKKPDFLFPNQISYHDPQVSLEKLRLLGAKSTLKDRWRQVLSEGDRIWPKHLITLDVAISANQMEEMRDSRLILVIPSPLQSSYQRNLQKDLWSLRRFIDEVRSIQRSD